MGVSIDAEPMRRPGSIWLVACVLAVYGAYGIWAATAVRFWAPGAMGLLTLVAAAGLLLGQRWSGLLIGLAAVLVIASWGYSIWIVARAGWLFPDAMSAALALLPGALLGAVFAASSVLVLRHFRRPPD
jgi:hypothetical protein